MSTPDDLAAAVAEHGWVVVTGLGGGGWPPLTSTVGLTAEELPELVVVGLPDEVGGALLREVAERQLAGFDEPDGLPLRGLLEGDTAPTLVEITEAVLLPAHDVFGEAVRARQLVWPDADGRMPWHPGFAHPDLQPLLGEAPPPPEARVAEHIPPDWPLPDDPHLQVLSSRPVAEADAPVLLVVCTDDGELHFLDGESDFDPEDAVMECLHEALERDLSLVEAVRPLQQGQVSERDAPGRPWRLADW